MESTLIYHQGSVKAHFAIHGKRIYHNTKVRVPEKVLDSKFFVKASAMSYASKLNEKIINRKKELDEALVKDLKEHGDIDIDRVRDILNGVVAVTPSLAFVDLQNSQLLDIFKRFRGTLIKVDRGLKWRIDLLAKILTNYKKPCSHLETITIANILETFYEGVNANTAGLRFKNFKRFYNWALKKGYQLPEIDWRQVRPNTYKADFVVLSEERVQELIKYKAKSEHQERIRQIFLILIYTGMRYSDYKRLDKDSIINGHILKITKKTITKFKIPVHPNIEEFVKNPPKMVGQPFNRSLKDLGKDLGWTEIVRFRTDDEVFEMIPFNMCLTSHVGRHTAATRWLKAGVNIGDILSWTGWTKSDMIFYYQDRMNTDTSASMKLIA